MTATLIGFGLLFAPDTQTDRLEAFVHDAALPGLRVINQAKAQTVTWPLQMNELLERVSADSPTLAAKDQDDLQARIVGLEDEVRRLQSQNAQLLKELDQSRAQSASPYLAEPGTPLFIPELLEASIIAADDVSVAVQRASAQRIVDVGQTDGIVPADFVVSPGQSRADSHQLLIDQGNSDGIHADQPVFAGRCVLGKVQQVGRWTSSLLPVTDSDYRGRAQLLRQTDRGLVVGPEGILTGDGKSGCQLNFIAATEPVVVGDEVYTAVEGISLPVPMYYGRVTAAELPEGSPYWDIYVKPAETIDAQQSVQVLRVILNPARTRSLSPLRESP